MEADRSRRRARLSPSYRSLVVANTHPRGPTTASEERRQVARTAMIDIVRARGPGAQTSPENNFLRSWCASTPMTPNFPPRALIVGKLPGRRFPAPAPRKSARDRSAVLRMGLCETLRMLHEIERVTSLHAQELAVDPAAVAIVAANDLVVADAECRAASIGAVRARWFRRAPSPTAASDSDRSRWSARPPDKYRCRLRTRRIPNDRDDWEQSRQSRRGWLTPSAPTPMPSSQARTQR